MQRGSGRLAPGRARYVHKKTGPPKGGPVNFPVS